MDNYTRLLLIAARTALRCERLLLRLSLDKLGENDVLTHNDECIRLQGIVEDAADAGKKQKSGFEKREP